MECKFAVTFEYSTRQPDTFRAQVSAGSAGTIARKALNLAKDNLKPRAWSSVSILLERLDDAEDMPELSDDISN